MRLEVVEEFIQLRLPTQLHGRIDVLQVERHAPEHVSVRKSRVPCNSQRPFNRLSSQIGSTGQHG
jgi:hypothetical protein